MRRRTRLTLAALLLLPLWSCGYALVGQTSNLPPDIEDIFIAPLRNATTRVQVEQFLTDAITEEMLARRRYRVVRSAREADAQLIGEITAFRVTPIAFDNEGLATEYEITITADVSFERVETEEQIWGNDHYQFRQIYEIDDSQDTFFDRENIAAEEAAERFAETIITDILEGF